MKTLESKRKKNRKEKLTLKRVAEEMGGQPMMGGPMGGPPMMGGPGGGYAPVGSPAPPGAVGGLLHMLRIYNRPLEGLRLRDGA